MKSDPIPIFFVHRGRIPRYLRVAMESARSFNAESPIFLLTDSASRLPKRLNVRRVLLDELPSEKLSRFEKQYVHRSSNPGDYERFCFARWFHAREAMARFGFSRAVHLDSDCLLCCDAAELFELFNAPGLTVGPGGGPHCTLINTSLDPLLDLFLRAFATAPLSPRPTGPHLGPAGSESTVLELALREAVCDMNLIAIYVDLLGGGQVYSSRGAPGANAMDSNIMLPDGFECWGGSQSMKRVRWKVMDGRLVPHLRLQGADSWVRALVLHYKGGAKRCMPRANVPGPQPAWRMAWTAWKYNTIPPRGYL